MSGVLEMQKIHLSYNILLPLQADSLLPLPLPQSLYGHCSVVYADVITNFLRWIDYQIFLTMGLHSCGTPLLSFVGIGHRFSALLNKEEQFLTTLIFAYESK